jgi:hypothetical protein
MGFGYWDAGIMSSVAAVELKIDHILQKTNIPVFHCSIIPGLNLRLRL